jgi:hypothetical protein
MTTNQDIQRQLAAAGFDPGPIDGRIGTRTIRAIKAFQVANGLAADGRAGPLTRAALAGDATAETADSYAPAARPSPGRAPFPRQVDCMSYYGGVGLYQKRLDLPFPMRLAWDRSVTITGISVHEKVHASAARVFGRIARRYDAVQRRDLGLDLFGGSLNVRPMRGGSGYSMHSWGIALDFDPDRNQLRWGADRARLARPDADDFWRFWEEEGWVSLGRSRNFDWMHVQAARL